MRRLSPEGERPLAQRWPLALALGGGWIVMLLFWASLLAFAQALKITVVVTAVIFAMHVHQQRSVLRNWRTSERRCRPASDWVALMFFIFAAAALAYDWLTMEEPADLLLAAILSALAVWVEREGLIYWTVIQAFLGHCSQPLSARWSVAIPFGFSVFIIAPWQVYLRWAQIPNVDFTSMTLSGFLAQTERLPIIADVWRRQLGRAANLFLLVCILAPLSSLAFSFVYSTWKPFTLHMNVLVARLVLHAVPLTWYLIAVLSIELDGWLRQMAQTKR